MLECFSFEIGERNSAMNIEFTKKQYEQLLKLVYLGNWLASAHRTDDRIKKFDDLESYVFSFAKEMGFGAFVDDEPLNGRNYFPTWQFEEGVHDLIEDYDDETFWEELIERLADMRFDEKYSEQDYQKMTREEYLEKYYEIYNAIVEIIERWGLEAILLKQ